MIIINVIFIEMEHVGPNKMSEDGGSDIMENLLPERYIYMM